MRAMCALQVGSRADGDRPRDFRVPRRHLRHGLSGEPGGGGSVLVVAIVSAPRSEHDKEKTVFWGPHDYCHGLGGDVHAPGRAPSLRYYLWGPGAQREQAIPNSSAIRTYLH